MSRHALLSTVLVWMWLIGLSAAPASAQRIDMHEQRAAPAQTVPPTISVTQLSTFPQAIVAGDTFEFVFGLANPNPGWIGNLSATITDTRGDGQLRSSIGTLIFLLPNLAPEERQIFSFEFTYEPTVQGIRELSLELDFTYADEDGNETRSSRQEFMQVRVLPPTPTPTPTPTAIPTDTPTPPPPTLPPVTQPPPPTQIVVVTPTPAGPSAVIAAQSVANVRDKPNLDAAVLASVPNGSRYPVLARNQDADWWLLDLGTTRGWVFGALLTLYNVQNVEVIFADPTATPSLTPTATPSILPPLPTPSQNGDRDIPETLPHLPVWEYRPGIRAEIVPSIQTETAQLTPGALFSITTTLHNISTVDLETVLLRWTLEDTTVVPIGAGTIWYIGEIGAGKYVTRTEQFYVNIDAPEGLTRLTSLVEYRKPSGEERGVPATLHLLIRAPHPSGETMDIQRNENTPDVATNENNHWFSRLISRLFAR